MIDINKFFIDCKILHQSKYDYKNVSFKSLKEKITIECKLHGIFSVTAASHLYEKKSCPKCKKINNARKWIEDIETQSIDKIIKGYHLKINERSFYLDGFNENKNIAYLYYDDSFNGNINIFDSKLINDKIGLSYKELYDKTIENENYLKNNGIKVVSEWESSFLKNKINEAKLIIHDNKYCQIIINNDKIFNKIKSAFSFKLTGVEYTAAYQNGWDGVNFLIDKNGYFLSGIKDRVQKSIENFGLTLQVIDKRKIVIDNKPLNISKKLKEINMEPRYYQQNILKAAINNNKGIIRACTGSGKTLSAALIAAHFNKPTIIYVIGLDLLKQFHDLFTSLFKEEIGFIGNGICNVKRINIASIWTISSALKIKEKFEEYDLDEKEIVPTESQSNKIKDMLKNANIHIFDESHVVTTSTIKEIYKNIDPERIYGFSGTPFRDDGSDLLIHSILGEQIINVSASELIAASHLAQPIIKFVRVPKTYNGSGTSNYQTVYKEYICENDIRNNLIIQNVKELLTKKYQVLILFKQLNHGKILKNLFDENEINYEYLSGNDSLTVRTQVKERLLEKKSNLVLASSIFDIGVDISSLSALILAGGGKSSIRALQRIGRIIRKFPGKKHVAVVDFYDDVRFLKNHSKKRHNIYSSEDGFKIIIPDNLKKEFLKKDDE